MRINVGDSVQYMGPRTDIEGHGEVVAHVHGSPETLVVRFGKDAYVINRRNLWLPKAGAAGR